jgi:hypothetical protein
MAGPEREAVDVIEWRGRMAQARTGKKPGKPGVLRESKQ